MNAGRYILGNPYSRFSLLRYPRWYWRFPWQRPTGGWLIGPLGFWWDGGATEPEGKDADVIPLRR